LHFSDFHARSHAVSRSRNSLPNDNMSTKFAGCAGVMTWRRKGAACCAPTSPTPPLPKSRPDLEREKIDANAASNRLRLRADAVRLYKPLPCPPYASLRDTLRYPQMHSTREEHPVKNRFGEGEVGCKCASHPSALREQSSRKGRVHIIRQRFIMATFSPAPVIEYGKLPKKSSPF